MEDRTQEEEDHLVISGTCESILQREMFITHRLNTKVIMNITFYLGDTDFLFISLRTCRTQWWLVELMEIIS